MSYKYGLQVTKKYTYICARRGKTCFQKTLLSAPEDVLRFLDLLKLFRSKGDFTFERHPRDARYILPASFLAATEADPHCGSRASRDASSASSIHSSIIIAAPATRAHRKMSLNFGYSFIQRYMEARAGIAGSSQIFRSVSPLARRRHIFSARAGEYRDGRPVFFFPVSVFLCFLLDKI